MPKGKLMNSDRRYYLFALKIMGDFGAAIAAPVVIFVLLGQWLDGRYGTNLVFTIFGFVIAFLISIRIIYKKAKIYGEQYSRLADIKKK